MQGSFDIHLKILKVENVQFDCTICTSRNGDKYYKIFNLDRIHVGGFRIDELSNKIYGGLAHHVEMVFSSYNMDNIIFKKYTRGVKRYRMSKRKATEVATQRTKVAISKANDIIDNIEQEEIKAIKDFNNI